MHLRGVALPDLSIRQAGQLAKKIMWYFYILQSKKDKKLYYGSTNDLKRRFSEHELGKVSSTMSRLPLKLVYCEAYLDENSARIREKTIKSSQGSRSALLKRINIGV